MRNSRGIIVASAVAFGLVSQSVAAQQSLRDYQVEGQSDVRAVASITIPLGGPRQARDTTPRLDFGVQARQNFDGADRPTQTLNPRFDSRFSEPRPMLSFTLEKSPKMLMAGERVATFGPTLHADEEDEGGGGNTVLYVVGGLLVLGVIGTVALVTDVRDAASDVIGPAD